MQDLLNNAWQYIQSLEIGPKNIIEIVILAYLSYHLMAWIKRTRTWFLFRGIFVLLLFVILAGVFDLTVITYLAERTLSVLVIALFIIFQPELRAALEQLGQNNYVTKLFGPGRERAQASRYSAEVTDELVRAAYAMAKTKTGALIVVERDIPLDEFAKTGITLDSVVSSELLINIFEKNTPLHDGAVVIRGNRVMAATCYLPLTSSLEVDKLYGTRHRAAIGVSEETDSLTIVVSEETGEVSLAMGGELKHGLNPDELKSELAVLEQDEAERTARSFLGLNSRSRKKKQKKEKTARTKKEADKAKEENDGPENAADAPELTEQPETAAPDREEVPHEE